MKISRKRLLDRPFNVRDARLCVIATEGEKTEKQYFTLFRDSRIQVKMLPTEEDHQSAPSHVLNRLEKFKQKHDLGEEDTLWLMIDVDHRRAEELAPICQAAAQKGFGLAVSNPCFELWLYLHLFEADTNDTTCQAVKTRLRTQLGSYNPSKLDSEVFRPHIAEAVRRAKALHLNPNDRWPAFPGTHVYKVVESLL